MEHLTVFLSDRDRHILRRMSHSLNRLATSLEDMLDLSEESRKVRHMTRLVHEAKARVEKQLNYRR